MTRNATAKKLTLQNQTFNAEHVFVFALAFELSRRTVCVTCVWAGVDNVREQEKLEARKMLENAAESPASGAPVKMGESHHFIRENDGLHKMGQKCNF